MLDTDATYQPDPHAPPAPGCPLDPALLLLDGAARIVDAPSANATSTPPGADARTVTPRRPLRFTASRSAEDAPAIALPVPNIFEGIFDDEEQLTDPRLLRSRARARALLAAHESRLSDAERNLWYDDPEPPRPSVPAPSDTTAQQTGGRRVRHLTAADIARHRPADTPIHDSLRVRLQDVRAALYDPNPNAPPLPPKPALTERLTVQALNAALIITALPVGIVVSAITLVRGEDLRLTSRAVAVVGTASALLKAVPAAFL